MNKKLLVASAILAAATMSFGLETWTGSEGVYKIETGFGDGTSDATDGYWYDYNDSNDGGSSSITWPTEKGNAYADDAMDPIIDMCSGLCGTATMGAGFDYPFVGIGFNVVNSAQDPADINGWGGFCLNYKSTGIAPAIEIAPANEATVTEYNNYKAALKIAANATPVELPWSSFKQEANWGKTVAIEEVLASAAAIKFKIADKAGKSTQFGIYQIGELGKCTGDITPIGSSATVSPVKAMLSGRTLSFAGLNNAANAEVINLQGQVVLKSAINASSALNLATLDAGVYMVRVSGKAINHNQKIVLK